MCVARGDRHSPTSVLGLGRRYEAGTGTHVSGQLVTFG